MEVYEQIRSIRVSSDNLAQIRFAVYPLCCSQAARALLGFALRDSAGGAQGGEGGAHEGRHDRGWGHPNPWRQRLRATPSGDELSRISSR